MTTPSKYSARLEFARRIALEAGELTLRYFQRRDVKVERKNDSSPVTVADREAELLLRERIAAEYPGDAILGEEFPERPGTSGYCWILDPIDGTKSFIHGVPLYGNMVAVEHGGQGIIGVINFPALREYVFAAVGEGAWYVHNDEPPSRCRVSTTNELKEACFLTSEVKTFQKKGRPEVYQNVEAAVRLTRTWGDCYGYMLVATGRADVMIDPMLNVWDAAAVQPIINEAGGRYSDWRGAPSIHTNDAVATNGLLHEQILKFTH